MLAKSRTNPLVVLSSALPSDEVLPQISTFVSGRLVVWMGLGRMPELKKVENAEFNSCWALIC